MAEGLLWESNNQVNDTIEKIVGYVENLKRVMEKTEANAVDNRDMNKYNMAIEVKKDGMLTVVRKRGRALRCKYIDIRNTLKHYYNCNTLNDKELDAILDTLRYLSHYLVL